MSAKPKDHQDTGCMASFLYIKTISPQQSREAVLAGVDGPLVLLLVQCVTMATSWLSNMLSD